MSWRYDELQTAVVLTLRGEGKPEWYGDDKTGRVLDVAGAGFSPPAEMKRPAEQDQAAPWANPFPSFRRWTTIVRLPPDTLQWRWTLYEDPVNLKLGGVSYHREAELVGGVLRSTMSIRTYLPEVGPEAAAELNAKLPDFNNKVSKLYQSSPTDERDLAADEKAAGGDARKLAEIGSSYLRTRRWADADRLFAMALKLDPDIADARLGRAAAVGEQGRLDEALKLLDDPRLSGDPLKAQYLRAGLLGRAKRKEEALSVLDAAARANAKRADVLSTIGGMFLDLQAPDRAQAVLADSLALDPADPGARQLHAEALEQLGRLPDALEDLERAVQSAPEDAYALRNRGAVYAKLGRMDEALADLEEAWRINPLSRDIVSARASALAGAGRGAEAPPLFDALIARDKSGFALNERCWARAIANVELAEAEKDCAEAVARGPKIASYWDSYALVAFRSGRNSDALKRYDEALTLQPDLAAARYARGLVKLKSGDGDGGRADMAAAISASPRVAERLLKQTGLKPD